MDRYAIFLDAGYVIHAGGELCCGTNDRKQVQLDVPGLRDYLNSITGEFTTLPNLRMYWYDAAPYGQPTSYHEDIAYCSNIKLRLGRIKSGRQKGVDALIYHDLVSLARERAISDAFLVSGDEDLREGVRTVQGMGVRIILIGIPPSQQETNQSRELIQEADECKILTKEALSGFFSLKKSPPESGYTPTLAQEPGPSVSRREPPIDSVDRLSIARGAGSGLANKIGPTESQVKTLFLQRTPYRDPQIPREIDRRLLYLLKEQLGANNVPSCLRREARASFWKTISNLSASAP